MSEKVLEERGKVRVIDSKPLPSYVVVGEQDPKAILKLLLSDERLEEIMYNGPKGGLRVYHKRYGYCMVPGLSPESANELIDYLLSDLGRGADHPIIEGQLSDGSRVSIVLRPIAFEGPYFSIRKFPSSNLTIFDLVRSGTLTPELAARLWIYVEGLGKRPANVLIVGGTGTGKTTLLASLAQLVPPNERIIVIEDTPEIRINHPNVIRMVTPPIGYGSPIEMNDLLKSALRMRPDRIIVGEVRGREAETLLVAMNTGHRGSMGTIHANTTIYAIKRLTSPPMSVPVQMLEALDVIISMARVKERRVVTEFSEVEGVDVRGPRLNVLYRYHHESGVMGPTGTPSVFLERFSSETGLSVREVEQIVRERERTILAAVTQRS